MTSSELPFNKLADHMGRTYLRYSFTKGTKQEVNFLFGDGIVAKGSRVLDVGCGPGRHAVELAKRGCVVHGIDISEAFIDVAREDAGSLNATFSVADARSMDFESEFDVAICICQGAFGMHADELFDRKVLAGIRRALKPGGELFLTAFNAYFSVRHHLTADFDAAAGVSAERTTVLNAAGESLEGDLITGCYTPRELRLMAEIAGFSEIRVFGAEPGAFGHAIPQVDLPELILRAKVYK